MKKLLTLLCLLMFSVATGWAQMTDTEVVDYIKTQTANGESQQTIAINLHKKGATQEQLQRIKTQYENANSKTGNTVVRQTVERLRDANGEIIPDYMVEAGQDDDKSTTRIFGHDIFRSKNLTFQPNMNIATPANYVLGPGDEVIVDVYGDAQQTSHSKIAPDGSITLDKIGPVSVAGLTATQAQSRIRSKMGAFYQGSSIKLSVGQTRTIIVNVLGEVKTPGTYTLSAFSTVFNALYLAGGITDIGTMRNIKVSRNGKVITTVDVYDYIANGKMGGNIMLQDNDVILVGAYENLVEITGHIKRPMFYEMKKNESLQSLLTLAGGFTGDAYKEKVRIERKSGEGLTVHNVDEWDYAKFHNEDGDVVFVAPIINRYKNMVTATGAVFRPGTYKLNDKVNSIKTLIEQAGGLTETAVVERAVIHRMKEDRTLTTIAVDLKSILFNDAPDITLQNEDELFIASNEKQNSSKYITIAGEIQNPGQYKYAENTTIEDLITQAGGLLESASINKIEVARRITNSKENTDGLQMAKIYSFDLNRDLRIEGGTNFTLEPYDVVTIHRNPDYRVQRRVVISGEVEYPGAYIISTKEDCLSDIIKRAGGLTQKAYINGAQLTRRYTAQEMDLKRQMLEIASTPADSIEAINQLHKTSYGIGINLSKALTKPGGIDDVILTEGDSIFIPKINNVVRISGEVLYPNSITYSKGKKIRYYLNQAGGVTENGRRRKSYILYSNGQVATIRNGKIEPGAEIIVPSKIEKQVNTAKVSMWATLASTVATVGAVVASIVR